ncbi:MAG: hypothetical protein IMZ53_12225 [Thermoplasmata archaeon]|nr:hypothetical protein [Thermoplasmata archaeon]
MRNIKLIKSLTVSICAVVLLVLGSLTNVVGYQTVQSTNQKVINDEIDQKELLFQTIVDIVNNKEIQRIILKSQLSRGQFPISNIPVLTKNQLKHMYLIGLILSKIISKSRIHSILEKYQVNNQMVQKEIFAVIQKDAILNAEIRQISNSDCDCENENIVTRNFTIICNILYIILIPIAMIWLEFGGFELIRIVTEIIMIIFMMIGNWLNCGWVPSNPYLIKI